jgi:uncharacterized FlaG/YvyC family protein
MTIDHTIPAVDLNFSNSKDSVQIQAENREVIQAVRAVNASVKLGDNNELTFSLDRHTRRPVIKIVNRKTNEVVAQIPNEQVLRLAEYLKVSGEGR